MTLFLQILLANAILVFLLITVHEIGHWCIGRLVGIPGDQMKIRLLTFPQQVQLRDEGGWLSVSTFDRYFQRLREMVPSVHGQFAYVAGGFIFETLFLVGLTCTLGLLGYWLYAIVAPGVSLMMYIVYVLAMDLPQSRRLQRPWGDTSILFSLWTAGGVLITIMMLIVRTGLIVVAWLRLLW